MTPAQRGPLALPAAILAALAALSAGRAASAAPPAGFPACREGYFCQNGQCISACNPPCPGNQVCIEGRRCDIPLPGSTQPPVFEPPPPLAKAFDDRRFFM